jgi:hypothetical protein
MMQEIRLLSESLKVINIVLSFFFLFFLMPIPPTSYPVTSKILITDIADFKFHAQ